MARRHGGDPGAGGGHVLDTFAERWDDPTPLDHRNPYRAVVHRLVEDAAAPEPLPERWDPPPGGGAPGADPAHLPGQAAGYPFAPDGERSIARAYSRAFTRARRLIYIEDQYFWSDVVADTLAEALRREPELQVIAVVPRYPEKDDRIGGPPMLYGQRRPGTCCARPAATASRLFDLENAEGTPIYVHAKVCVVDDPWMTIGSDNLNLRSWTHDSEVTCAVVDPAARCPAACGRRCGPSTWGFREDEPRLSDLNAAMDLWAEREGAPGSRIRRHVPPAVSTATRRWARPAYPRLYDPDGRPRRLRGTTNF